MGIVKHVENLRQRPEHERRRIALAYSGGMTAVIFLVWLTVLFPAGYERRVAQRPAADPGMTESIGGAINTAYTNINGNYRQMAEGFDPFEGSANGTAAAYDAFATTTAGEAGAVATTTGPGTEAN